MKLISTEDVISTYRLYAPVYDGLFGIVLEAGRRALSEAVCSLSPASLLEVGVGTGLLLPRYPACAAITGVDISSEMLEHARRRVGHLRERSIDLRIMNAEELAFPDRTFDCVTVPYVLSVTPSPERLVSEIRRVCKQDGTILILNHFSGSRFWWCLERAFRPMAARVGFRSDFGLEEHILRYDWRVESVDDVNLFGLSKLVAIKNT